MDFSVRRSGAFHGFIMARDSHAAPWYDLAEIDFTHDAEKVAVLVAESDEPEPEAVAMLGVVAESLTGGFYRNEMRREVAERRAAEEAERAEREAAEAATNEAASCEASCEEECQEACAHPGTFTECETVTEPADSGAAYMHPWAAYAQQTAQT